MFTKNDLKSGDFVVRRNCDVEVYLDVPFNHFVAKNGGYNLLSNLKDDLCSKGLYLFDIMKVYRPKIASYCTFGYFEKRQLIFDRERDCNETIMTISEIENSLGITNLKIVKEKT